MNDGKGTSLVLIRTEKGKCFFNEISSYIRFKEVSYSSGVRENPAEYKSAVRPLERDKFFNEFSFISFEELSKQYLKKPPVSVKRKIKNRMKYILNIIFQKNRGGHTMKDMDYYLCFVLKTGE